MRALSRHGEWTVGELAAELGINPKTVRYYGQIGLLPAPRRTAAGYRVYGTAERDRLRFILKAKAVGLTLDEIASIVGLRRDGLKPCAHVLELLNRKVATVDEQLQALSQYRQELIELAHEAERTSRASACVCGIIEQHQSTHPDATRKALAVLTHQPTRKGALYHGLR